jgi:hypothetical protein
MMASRVALWIDENQRDFPAVKRILRKSGYKLASCYDVASAIEYLSSPTHDEPAAIILDALVPFGEMEKASEVASEGGGAEAGTSEPNRQGESGKGDEYVAFQSSCSGLSVLRRFPSLGRQTVVVSVVPRDRLEREGLPSHVHSFRKSDLGHDLDDLRLLVDRYYSLGGGSEELEMGA